MQERYKTIFPDNLAGRLEEYEKIRAFPSYGTWKAKKLLKRTDFEEMLTDEQQWICMLIWANNPQRKIPDLIFEQIEMDAYEFGTDRKLLASFAISGATTTHLQLV